jgi:hypothetical protein
MLWFELRASHLQAGALPLEPVFSADVILEISLTFCPDWPGTQSSYFKLHDVNEKCAPSRPVFQRKDLENFFICADLEPQPS